MTSEGTVDDTGKQFHMAGTFDDPMTGKQRAFRSISRLIDDNSYVEEMFYTDDTGKEFKSVEVTYTRAES